ncbi:uncharacterized protein PAC_11562 [Phialocephala subalpina]|uniref:Cytochrome P450 n=1 Tax=Phialocephala subalpina TaxID=576137 RepID=A0A1L7X9G2_9HELO|nr:uncharacterized protein PAC_11562 [Phialocephala subalpina]
MICDAVHTARSSRQNQLRSSRTDPVLHRRPPENICDYAFGRSMGFLEDPTKGKEFDFHSSFFRIGWVVLEIPYLNLKRELQGIIDGNSERFDVKRRTIFHDYVEADLPPSVKTAQGFVDDADILIGAGYETPGHTLSTATFHILDNPKVYEKLVADLIAHWSNPAVIASWKELENISYLHATVKEALRMSIGVLMRLPRVNHTSPIQYQEWEIPPHTIISMTQRDILFDPSIFTDPYTFRPERWLDAKTSKHLDKHPISFSKGTRGYLGKDLAMAEIQIMLATLFRRFDMQPMDTTLEDIEFDRDFMLPMPKAGHDNVKVAVKGTHS